MTADATGLRCPHCGAAAEPDSGRCRYCQARLATISCPSCFTLGFDGAAYCHKCGAARVRLRLRRVDVGATPLFECAACDGVWVDADTFERLCAQGDAQRAVLQRIPAPRPSPAPAAAIRYRPCLRCGKMMNRVNFGTVSGAVIDVCRGHGTFLDAGELHRIVAFIQDGGLERARARKLEDLREEERRIRQLERRAKSDVPASGGTDWNDAAGVGIGVVDLIAMITDAST
jgi:Zn-finger nucleic acid-binding protein